MNKFLFVIVSLFLLAGCGQTIVLLPDLDGNTGEITVTPRKGEAMVLNCPNQAVSGNNKVYIMDDAEVESVFGEALAAQPLPTARFILYFFSDSIELDAESKDTFLKIVKEYRARLSSDISVVGHTDTAGDKQYNYALSLRRALKVKEMLEKEGVPPQVIYTTSHGEANPVIRTADNMHERRNRRVEVMIR